MPHFFMLVSGVQHSRHAFIRVTENVVVRIKKKCTSMIICLFSAVATFLILANLM